MRQRFVFMVGAVIALILVTVTLFGRTSIPLAQAAQSWDVQVGALRTQLGAPALGYAVVQVSGEDEVSAPTAPTTRRSRTRPHPRL